MSKGPFEYAYTPNPVIPPGSITNADLANMAARTVKVNATNASASPQDLQATVALSYLRLNAAGNGLEWGTLPAAAVSSVFGRTGAVVATNGDYTASQVTNVPAGNISSVTVQAAINELDTEKAPVFTVDATLGYTANVLSRQPITGDVAIAGGSNTSAIGNNKVTNAMLAQGAARTVVGVAGNATANRGDIAGGGAATFLRDSGTALAFSALTAGDFPANTMALAGLANAAAQYDIIGRKTAGGGAWEDCTSAQLLLARTDLRNSFVTTTGQLINGGSGNATTNSCLNLQSDDAGNLGPRLMFYHNSASPAVNDIIGVYSFKFNSLAPAELFGSQQFVTVTNTTLGSEACTYNVQTLQAGGTSTRFSVAGGVFTQGGSDLGVGHLYAAGVVRTAQYTVATLPAAATVGAGAQAFVTDSAAAPVFSVAAVGGGTLGIPVTSDGTTWRNG